MAIFVGSFSILAEGIQVEEWCALVPVLWSWRDPHGDLGMARKQKIGEALNGRFIFTMLPQRAEFFYKECLSAVVLDPGTS